MIRSGIFAAIVLLAPTVVQPANSVATHRSVRLAPASLDYARKLIAEGRISYDKHGGWTSDKPLVAVQNEFIRQHDFEAYGRWYLGLDESRRKGTKARYKFPFGDFKNVHRCALIAARDRAQQYGYEEIANAATELLDMIEQKR
jgi:hypothetical protein